MQRLQLTPCEAPFWANSGHGQTLWAHFLKSPELSSLGTQLEVDLPDGDRLFCYYHQGSSDFVVSLYHGLTGDTQADYMQRTALLCQRLGHTVVLVNHRGAGGSFAHAKKPYHSGKSDDMAHVLEKLKEKFPGKKQIAIGYSMSGNILLCLLGGFRGHVKPDGAITINAPINLKGGSQLLHTGLNRIYDLRFVSRVRQSVEEKYKHGVISEKYKISPLARLWDVDQIYTAPASGFRDREDYYATCSALNYLSNIETPTYSLTASDDPFISVVDYQKANFSKSTHVHIEKRGGHLGYLAKKNTPLGSRRWMDYYIHEALRALESTLK